MGKARDYYDGILQEDIRDQLKYIIEALHALRNVPADVAQLKDDVKDLKSDMFVIKEAFKDMSQMVNSHEFRITTLEAK